MSSRSKEPDLEEGENAPLLAKSSDSARRRELRRAHSRRWQDTHKEQGIITNTPRTVALLGLSGLDKGVTWMRTFAENPQFTENVVLSLRAAFGCVILALPVLVKDLFPFFHHWFMQQLTRAGGWVTGIVFMIFTLGPTVGASVSVAYQGMFGVLAACLNIFVMFGFFPDGTTQHPVPFSAPVWYIAAADFFIFLFLVIFLNLSLDFKLFAACEHCWFMMCFMNPGHDYVASPFAKNFRPTMDGVATSELIATFIAVNFAVLAAFFPVPVWSRNNAKRTALQMDDTMGSLWDVVIDYYCGPGKSALVYRCRKEAAEVDASLKKFEVMIDRMYYECFDFGTWGCVRKQLMVLSQTLEDSLNCALVAIACAEQEEFEPAHIEIMKELEPELRSFQRTAQKSMELAIAACLDGHLDEDEEEELRRQSETLRKACQQMSLKFSTVRTDVCKRLKVSRMSQVLLGEHAFALSMSNYGRSVQGLVEQVLESKVQAKPDTKLMMNPFDTSVLFTTANTIFTLRNFGAITASFVVGFIGFPFQTGSLIKPYTSAIAVTTSLLLSSFAGSAMQKNLGRLQGVALGTVIGQLFWVYFAWCTPVWKQWEFTVVFFIFMYTTIYIYHSSPEYGYIGSLLAVFGAKAMLVGCSDVVGFDGSSKYSMLVYVTCAILIMLIFDVVLASKRASSLAVQTLSEATDFLLKELEDFFDPHVKSLPPADGKYDSALASAMVQAAEATKEPRHWRGPWQESVMKAAIKAHQDIKHALMYLTLTISTTGHYDGEKSALALKILSLPECSEVVNHIADRFHVIFTAADVVLRNEAPCKYTPKFFEELEKKKKVDQQKIESLLLASEKIAGAESDRMLKGEPEVYLHSYPICQCAMFVAQLLQISDTLAALETELVRYA